MSVFSVVRELLQMCGEDKEPCLICYEKPGEFCHRHLVAAWIRNAGFEVREWNNNILKEEQK